MELNLGETASPLEIFYTLPCLLALCICVFLAWRVISVLVWYYVRRQNGLRRLAAWLLSVLLGGYALIVFSFVVAGGVSMIIPPPTGDPVPTGAGVAVAVAFILSAAVAVTASLLAVYFYNRIINYAPPIVVDDISPTTSETIEGAT
jgi:hypothetical protein